MRFQILLFFMSIIPLIGVAQDTKTPGLYRIKVKKNQLSTWLSPGNLDQPIIAAHRGGRFIKGYPENALETFEYVLQSTPAIMECDVEMSSDSVLILLHDNKLDRTTTGSGAVKETPWVEIDPLKLIDDFGDTTDFEVPTLEEALKWCKKKTILELDVKRGVPFDKVIQLVEKVKVEDYVVIITYNVADAQQVYALNPKLKISVGMRNEKEFQRMKEAGIPFENLIAFTGTRMSPKTLYESIHKAGVLNILGTLGNLDKKAAAEGDQFYQDCIDLGIDILATDRPIEAAKAIGIIPKEEKAKTKFYSIKK